MEEAVPQPIHAEEVKEISSELKLFGRWRFDDVTVQDMALQDYIYVPHHAAGQNLKPSNMEVAVPQPIHAEEVKEISSEVKLFGRWGFDDVTVQDMALQDYIGVPNEKFQESPVSHC